MSADRDPIAEARSQWIRHGWADAADGMAMVTALVRAQQLLLERITAVLRPWDLTFARYETLRVLAFTRSGEMSMARLGSLLQVHPTSVTSAVTRLERQGFVERRRDSEDRRIVLASITPQGRAVVESATAGLNAEVFAGLGLTSDEVSGLSALLNRVRETEGDPV